MEAETKNQLISVIVPAYNAQNWIAECVQSVYAQTYPAWELIVVDDGSSDKTLEIVRKTAEDKENVTVITRAHSGGGIAGKEYRSGGGKRRIYRISGF